MSAFSNGVLSALNRCLDLIKELDPEEKNKDLQTLKKQIDIWIITCKEIDEARINFPIIDNTWKNIEKSSESVIEESDDLLDIDFDA